MGLPRTLWGGSSAGKLEVQVQSTEGAEQGVQPGVSRAFFQLRNGRLADTHPFAELSLGKSLTPSGVCEDLPQNFWGGYISGFIHLVIRLAVYGKNIRISVFVNNIRVTVSIPLLVRDE